MNVTKPLTVAQIDVGDDRQLDGLVDHVLAEGDKIYATEREQSLRLGVIDERDVS